MLSKVRDVFATWFPWLCQREQPENDLRRETTHEVGSTEDNDDPMFDCGVERHGSDSNELAESEHNQRGIRGDPNLLPDRDYFLFYTLDPSSSNALTKAFMARSSPEKNSTIQVSTMKLLRCNATVGEFYTLSWQVERQESRFSTRFETIADRSDDFKVVLGTERSIDISKDQGCIPNDCLGNNQSSRDSVQAPPNSQDKCKDSQATGQFLQNGTLNSSGDICRLIVLQFVEYNNGQSPRLLPADGFDLGKETDGRRLLLGPGHGDSHYRPANEYSKWRGSLPAQTLIATV